MKRFFPSITLLIALSLIVFSCQKEISKDGLNKPADNPGSGSAGTWGWSFKAAQGAYQGCIDTAYYQSMNGVKALSIEGTDSANNYFLIAIAVPSGSLKPGTYSVAQGAVMEFQDQNGKGYISTQANTFSIKLATVNDTLVEGTFSASLTDALGGPAFNITEGKLKAMIGKTNPCNP